MKHRCLRLALRVATLAAVGAAFCPSVRSADTASAVFVEPTTPEVKEIQSVGEYAINRLAVTLVNELRAALAKGSPEDAVEIAHLKSLPMTGDKITGLPRITAVKRTSLRVRAPANAPDPADQLALDHIERALNAGESPPKILVQRLETPGAPSEWRVYRPLGINPQCVMCHGDPAEQSPALRAKLDSLYPGDKATGYAPGEWRGLIRVTVSAAPAQLPKPPAKKMVLPSSGADPSVRGS